jgi:hypothetical protein
VAVDATNPSAYGSLTHGNLLSPKPQTFFKKGEPFSTKLSTRLLMEAATANAAEPAWLISNVREKRNET